MIKKKYPLVIEQGLLGAMTEDDKYYEYYMFGKMGKKKIMLCLYADTKEDADELVYLLAHKKFKIKQR